MILLDTDHLSVLTKRQATGHALLIERLENADEPLAIPIVCVEEQCKGWLAKIHRMRDIHQQIAPYDRLTEFFNFLAEWDMVSLDAAAADAFDQFRSQKIRIGSQDLKIAAIALTQNALLLSANLRDFRHVPGLRVENWLGAD